MLGDEVIQSELERCDYQLDQIQGLAKTLPGLRSALIRQKKTLLALRQSQQNLAERQGSVKTILREVQLSLFHPDTDSRMVDFLNVTGSGRKPDVQVLEENFLAYGPMHLHDVVRRGQERGIAFKGRKPPYQIAREKLSSSKRFHLFGNNVWGLPHQELPDHYYGAESVLNVRHAA